MEKEQAIRFYSENDNFKNYINNYLRNNRNETLESSCDKIIIRDIAEMYLKISKEGRVYDRKGIS